MPSSPRSARRRRTPLLKVSVRTHTGAEEAACRAIEAIFGVAPVVESKPENPRIAVSAYLDGTPQRISALRASVLKQVRAFDPNCRVSLRGIRHEDWAESWKRHFQPLDIGRLLIKPGWSKRKPRKNQEVVILDPGLSFGTGQHPTTKFCLEQIVREHGLPAGRRGSQGMLDLGTGSGILAIAAAKLGYAPIMAIDNDPDAIRIARENAKLNKASVRFAVMELSDLRRQSFDIVCANLTADVLVDSADKITAMVTGGGCLVLAGILKSQFDSVLKEFVDQGLKTIRVRAGGIWKSVALRRNVAA